MLKSISTFMKNDIVKVMMFIRIICSGKERPNWMLVPLVEWMGNGSQSSQYPAIFQSIMKSESTTPMANIRLRIMAGQGEASFSDVSVRATGTCASG